MTRSDILVSGEKVVLRRFRPEDHDDVHAFASDPDVCRFMSWGPNSQADTRDFLAQAVTVRPSRLDLAILADQRLIGSASVWTTDIEHRTGELGYTLRADAWGQGHGTDAARALLRLGAEHLRLERIAATCDVDNLASARVLGKIGMSFEGILRGYRLVRGERRDHLAFARLIESPPIELER
ncbi:GNAT family N-acetyltransferase [Prescottella equi]|uniref:GNAT family N-acetyltransferase n=1 Tax=Rhodococcus hoagii TaxID=43767 RepID=UPI0009C18235|nr:GNAT family N-acetyltransferase [Prescottella equi]